GHTRAIIFDMRGYPNRTVWSIAPRLNIRRAHSAATFRRSIVKPGYAGLDLAHAFVVPIFATDKPVYRGKTFMLVDERTMSQADPPGLFSPAAAGTTFVGSQTAGTNGDLTTLKLPGGLLFSFTGHEVRYPDGRPLQRVGLAINVRVAPTLKGLQAGRDEVL